MTYGDGRVYSRGKRWAIAYYGPQGEEREGGFRTKADAERALARRIREVLAHREGLRPFLGPDAAKLTIEAIVEAYLEDAETRRLKSVRPLRCHAKRVVADIGGQRIAAFSWPEANAYAVRRRQDHAADATIDRELEVVRAAFRLAYRSRKIAWVPPIPSFGKRNANARRGFIAPAQFWKLLDAVESPDFADFLEWFWWTAQRPGEIASLRWESLDEFSGQLRIEAEDAKIGRARVVPVRGERAAILKRRAAARRPGVPWIFHVDGERAVRREGGFVTRLYGEWRRALAAAELPEDLIAYDLRRSALRNLRQAGASEREAMEISGHKTRETFDRYSIVTTEDMAGALERAERVAGRGAPETDQTRTDRRGGRS